MQQREHLGIIKVSTAILHRLLQLPDDYQVVAMHLNPLDQTLVLTVEHPDLPTAGEWQQLPDVLLTYESHHDAEANRSYAVCIGTTVQEHPNYTKTEYLKLL